MRLLLNLNLGIFNRIITPYVAELVAYKSYLDIMAL